MPESGPASGWVIAYLELLASEYGFTVPHILLELPVEAGSALLEARAARLNPGNTIGFVQRSIIVARTRMRNWLEANFDIQ